MSSAEIVCLEVLEIFVLPTALIFNQTWMEKLIVLLCNYPALGYSREIFTHKSRPYGEERINSFQR